MAYVTTRGGEHAIEQSERIFRAAMREITPGRVARIRAAMPYLADRVMGEASLYDEDLAALALAQTGGELYEAVLLLRAWRTTQPRISVAKPVTQESLFTHWRISAAFKDIPGGQVLGPTLDYAHRFLATEVLDGHACRPDPVVPAATLGWNEVTVIAAATLDQNAEGAPKGSATEAEFFLHHTEGVESSGFGIHFKLPHSVTFQSGLDAMRDAKTRMTP